MTKAEQQKRDSIHESGHCVLAKLFEDKFIVKSITLNPKMFEDKTNVTGWRGGIQISPKNRSLSSEDVDKLMVIMWGGLCSQNIHDRGIGNIDQHLINRMSVFWKQELDQEGFSGDFEFTFSDINKLSIDRKIPRDEYEISIIHFILNFQIRSEVWFAIEQLSAKILNKDTMTLDSNEIDGCFKECGFQKFIEQHRNSIINKRYDVIPLPVNEPETKPLKTTYWSRFLKLLNEVFQ